MTVKQTKIGTVAKMIMIPPEYIEQIKPILRRHNLTFSAFAREALKMALEAYEQEEEKEETRKPKTKENKNEKLQSELFGIVRNCRCRIQRTNRDN